MRLDEISDYADQAGPLRRAWGKFWIGSFPLLRAEFYEQLAVFGERQTPFAEAVRVLFQSYTNDGRSKPAGLALMLADLVRRHMEGGQPFVKILMDWLPPSEALLLESCYQNKLSPTGLRRLEHRTRELDKTISEVFKAAVPVAIIFLIFTVGAWVGSAIYLPQVLSGFRNIQLQGSAYVILHADEYLSRIVPIFTVTSILLLLLIRWALPNLAADGWIKFLGFRFLRVPLALVALRLWLDRYIFPFTLYREWTGVAWLQFLSAAMSAGRRERDANEAFSRLANPYVLERIQAVLDADNRYAPTALMEQGYDWPSRGTLRQMAVMLQGDDPAKNLESLSGHISERLLLRIKTLSERVTVVLTVSVLLLSVGGLLASSSMFESFSSLRSVRNTPPAATRTP